MTNPSRDPKLDIETVIRLYAALEQRNLQDPDPGRTELLGNLRSLRDHLVHADSGDPKEHGDELSAAVEQLRNYLELVERSSLGTPGARRQRRRSSPTVTSQILARSDHQLAESGLQRLVRAEQHLTSDAVVAFVDAELSPTAHERAASHAANCLSCAAEISAQRQARSLVPADHRLVVLAVDSEKDAMASLQVLLSNNRYVRRIISVFDATGAMRVLRGDDEDLAQRQKQGFPVVDAVFSELKMPGLAGVEMAGALAALTPSPALVFVTKPGEGEHAVEMFELGALDMIPNPCDQPRMDRAIQRVISKLRGAGVFGTPPAVKPSQDDLISVEVAGTLKVIPRSSVRWVEAQGDHSRLFTSEGSHLMQVPLSQLEELWTKHGFVRIHRSYLVLVNLITDLLLDDSGHYYVIIGNGERKLPVSQRHTGELKDRITSVGSRSTDMK